MVYHCPLYIYIYIGSNLLFCLLSLSNAFTAVVIIMPQVRLWCCIVVVAGENAHPKCLQPGGYSSGVVVFMYTSSIIHIWQHIISTLCTAAVQDTVALKSFLSHIISQR